MGQRVGGGQGRIELPGPVDRPPEPIGHRQQQEADSRNENDGSDGRLKDGYQVGHTRVSWPLRVPEDLGL